MATEITQINKILEEASSVLITGPKNPNLDIVSTAAAWYLILLGKNKKVDLAFDGEVNLYSFIPKAVVLKNNLENLYSFRIAVDISQTKVRQLSYDIQDDNKLVIDIVPEGGVFKDTDVHTETGDYKYDLVISLGADSLESLGQIFSNDRHFFQVTNIINIDTSIFNENFGQLNIVASNVTSVAEASYDLLQESLDKQSATCLLAGMIAATSSFQSPKVTPHTLELASELIIRGADREKIIEDLYRTKDINTLKNWGKVLSRLKREGHVITSFLKHDELETLPQEFTEMVKDLILSTPNAQVAIIFYQLEFNQTEVWLYTTTNIDALDLVRDRQGSGDRHLAKIILNEELDGVREGFVSQIAKKLEIINSL